MVNDNSVRPGVIIDTYGSGLKNCEGSGAGTIVDRPRGTIIYDANISSRGLMEVDQFVK